MPKRGALALSLTTLALALLLSFRVPTDPSTGTVSATGDAAPVTGDTGSTGTTGDAGGTGAGSAGTGVDPTAGTRTIDGPVVQTRFGPVQVSITLDGTEVTGVTALQLPDGDHHSAAISDRVAPVLSEQALEAQSASIDGVSGATYTSTAYARSLQAALDSAGI